MSEWPQDTNLPSDPDPVSAFPGGDPSAGEVLLVPLAPASTPHMCSLVSTGEVLRFKS